MIASRQLYYCPSGVADGSQVQHDLREQLLEIAGSASVALTCIEEGTLDDVQLALRDITEAVLELPRLESRLLSWERRWGALRQPALARAGR